MSSRPEGNDQGVRLQKVLALAGYGSRRKCEQLIEAGRVTVNDELVVGQGMRVLPDVDVIRVDGQRISPPSSVRVLAVNKPLGVLSAMADDRGRRNLGDLLRDYDSNLRGFFHVGRLDLDTSGLILLTNNGELAHRLAHPSFGVEKTYVAQVATAMKPATANRLRAGVEIDGRKVHVHRLHVRASVRDGSLVEVTIHEGRKHIVRRLLAEVGHPVVALTRTRFGPIELKGEALGAIWPVSDAGVARLYDAIDMTDATARTPVGDEQ